MLSDVEHLLDSIDDVVWFATADGHEYAVLNRAVERVYGRPRQEFLDDPDLWTKVVHPDDRKRVAASHQQLLATGVAELEYRVVHPDERVVWIRDRKAVIHNSDGSPAWIGGIAVDVTATRERESAQEESRRKLEGEFAAQAAALDRAESRYTTLFEAAGDPIYTISAEGVITSLNPAWQRVTGHLRSEWLGESFLPLVHPEDIERTQDVFQRALAGEHVTYESRFRSGAGEWRHSVHTLAPMPGEGVVGIARDVTEQRQLEYRLQQSQKLESLGVLSGGIAHDFNNILMGVIGAADLARQLAGEASPLAGQLDQICESGRQLADLTQQMLAYAGRAHRELADVDVAALADGVRQLASAALPKGAVLDVAIPPELPRIHADEGQIRQVIMNLLLNAAQALPQRQGTVAIEIERVAADADMLAGVFLGEHMKVGEYVSIAVIDNGKGMDADTRRRMFDPFFTTKQTGRGLGLASVWGILRAHRGGIEVSSRPGTGTSVRVLLPTAPVTGEATRVAMTAVARTATVLVVDDEEVVRAVAGEMLAAVGHAVHTATSGDEAIELLGAHPEIEVVLLDLIMPDRDGIDVLDEIRRDHPHLPVILTSGFGASEMSARLGERSCVLLSKPYQSAQLLDAVETALNTR